MSNLLNRIETIDEQIGRLLLIIHKMQDKIQDLELHVASLQYDVKIHCGIPPCEEILKD